MDKFESESSNVNPMDHPEEQPVDSRDEPPKFGRLLIVLVTAVMMIGILTFAAEAYYR